MERRNRDEADTGLDVSGLERGPGDSGAGSRGKRDAAEDRAPAVGGTRWERRRHVHRSVRARRLPRADGSAGGPRGGGSGRGAIHTATSERTSPAGRRRAETASAWTSRSRGAPSSREATRAARRSTRSTSTQPCFCATEKAPGSWARPTVPPEACGKSKRSSRCCENNYFTAFAGRSRGRSSSLPESLPGRLRPASR